MTTSAYIAGAFEHPTRKATDLAVGRLYAECIAGALADAGLEHKDIDGFFCAGDAPGLGALSMVDYMGMTLRHVDTTETGGSSYIVHLNHAAQAIAADPACAPRSAAAPLAAACTRGGARLCAPLAAALDEAGFRVSAIRPPTVAAGTARLRFTLNAAHSQDNITALLAAFAQAAQTISKVLT